jgi:hypothetical protein
MLTPEQNDAIFGLSIRVFRVKERQTELEALLRRFDDELPRHPSLRIEDESLVVGPLNAEDKPDSLVTLEALINARLPLVELPDLLMEVDGWTGFSRHFEHASGAEPRAPELLVHCHASILAQACNFGLTLKTRMEGPKIASFCSGVSICGSMGSHPEGPSRSDGIILMLSRLRRFDSLHSRF